MTDVPKDKRFLNCDAIQDVLTAYMSRELGDAPSLAVREHLRTCESCRREAADIQATLDALKATMPAHPETAVLSDDRRKRLARAVMHPIQAWLIEHHRMIALIATCIILGLTLYVIRNAILLKPEPDYERIPIWRYFKSGELPGLVEDALENQREFEANETLE